MFKFFIVLLFIFLSTISYGQENQPVIIKNQQDADKVQKMSYKVQFLTKYIPEWKWFDKFPTNLNAEMQIEQVGEKFYYMLIPHDQTLDGAGRIAHIAQEFYPDAFVVLYNHKNKRIN